MLTLQRSMLDIVLRLTYWDMDVQLSLVVPQLLKPSNH